MNSESTELLRKARQLVERATITCTNKQDFEDAEYLLGICRMLWSSAPDRPLRPKKTPIPPHLRERNQDEQ